MLTYWVGNAPAAAQVDGLLVGGTAAAAATLTVTINGKPATYTLTGTDTLATAAAGLAAALQAAAATAPEFGEQTYAVDAGNANRVLATSALAGRPFTLAVSAAGGVTLTRSAVVVGSSPSDVGLAANWSRGGTAALPQNGDDVVLGGSAVPLLWNLTALAAVQFATLTRAQSFTAAVGLNEANPAGFAEYRPLYFQFSGPPAAALPVRLGGQDGLPGGGPARERYDAGAQQVTLELLAAGAQADAYGVLFKGSNPANTVSVMGASLGMGVLPGEAPALATATVTGGGSLGLGAGVTNLVNLILTGGGRALFACGFTGTVTVGSGSAVTVVGPPRTHPALVARSGATAQFLTGGTLTSLTLAAGSRLDKSLDNRSLTIINAVLDGDTCQILDPFGCITYSNPVTVNNLTSAGPFPRGVPHNVRIT